MSEEDDSAKEIKDKIKLNNNEHNINDRYHNVDINPTPENKNTINRHFFNQINTDEDLDIELEAISQKIPLENFGINIKEERYIKLENNNKISPLQRKKKSKIHRHKSYDYLCNHNIKNDNQKNNNNDNINNYNKINYQKRKTPNIKTNDENMRRDFNEQIENPNNKTEYDLYRENKNKKYGNVNERNTINANDKNISYFKNNNKYSINTFPVEIDDNINDDNKNSSKNNKNANLINLKAAQNNNNYFINIENDEIQNIIIKNEELEKNFKDIFNKIEINDNIKNNENKYNDDESLVKKIENKLKNKFETNNNIEEYFNRTPIIRNNYLNYFDEDFVGNDSENKNESSNNNNTEIVFKPTNINKDKNQNNNNDYYTNQKTQNIKLINQNKRLKEENRILKEKNEKLSEKIMHIEREQRKKNNNESSLLQKIKKLENQLKQKDKLISKISNKNNFNNIKRIKIISFFIRNRNNNFRNNYFKNLKIRTAENIRLFPDYLKETEFENDENDNEDMNTGENFVEENEELNEHEYNEDEDEDIDNYNNINEREDSKEGDSKLKKNVNQLKNLSMKKNKSNKVFSSIINNIQNNYKHLNSNSSNNTININKFDYKKEKYHHSLPVSNKKKSNKNYVKKSIYEFFEKSNTNNNKDYMDINKTKNKSIISKKISANKYNQNYNINFYKNNCYNNNFVSLFQKEDDTKNKNNTINNGIESINYNKKDKPKTSLIMSVLNDNLLGNMNFNAKTKIETNNKKISKKFN